MHALGIPTARALCLAQAMLPLFDVDDGEAAAAEARELLAGYEPVLVKAYAEGMRAKLGLLDERDEDGHPGSRLLDLSMTSPGCRHTPVSRRTGGVTWKSAAGPEPCSNLSEYS